MIYAGRMQVQLAQRQYPLRTHSRARLRATGRSVHQKREREETSPGDGRHSPASLVACSAPHLFRSCSARACRHAASPLNAERLNEARPLHPLRDALPSSLASVAAMSTPLSRSDSPSVTVCGTAMAADGLSFLVRRPSVGDSSVGSSR